MAVTGSPGRTLSRRVLVLPLIAVAAVAVPQLAPIDAAASDSAVASATVVLRTVVSPESLARTAILPRQQRLQRLVSATPSVASRRAVTAGARSLGLTIDDVTPWSLVLHGSQRSIRRLAGQPGVGQIVLSGGPQAKPANNAQPLRGYQLRGAYQTSSAAPPAGATQPTVATLQFSGWNSAELAGYVSFANTLTNAVPLPPLAPGQFTAVQVGNASTSGGMRDGQREVALDQESIYDNDPYARQRAYFANNSLAGLVAALDRVALDATTMPSLTALSISWTWCESSIGYNDATAIHQALATVVAAGITVFAATGDEGSTCNGATGVAYPASDPLVIAVGGTRLTLGPTTETGWPGSGGGRSLSPSPAWQTSITQDGKRLVPDIAADADLDTGAYIWHDEGQGSGAGPEQVGGTSLSSAVSAALYAAELGSRGATNGGLGDLHPALYTAPAAAFRDITSGDNGYQASHGYDKVTGLGAPLWGPVVDWLLTQPVVSVPATVSTRTVPVTVFAPAGQSFIAWDTGYGNPPSSCGTATGHPADPAPVTVPTDGSFQIWAEGWVGLNHCFIATTSTVVSTVVTPPGAGQPPPVVVTTDVTPPKVSLTARRTSVRHPNLSFSWHSSDPSGVASVEASYFVDGKPIWRRTVSSSASLNVVGHPGHAYRLSVVATDAVGNSAGLSRVTRLPYDDRNFQLGKGWHRATSNNTYGGSYIYSSRVGASATIKTSARTFSLLTSTGPARGIVAVYVDGKLVHNRSLYNKVLHPLVEMVLVRFSSAARHRITLVVKGTHAPESRGVLVPIDGLLAL